MIKHMLIAVLIIASLLSLSPVYAQNQISVLDSTTEVYFPSALVFTIKAESSSDITKIRLHYQVDKMSYAQVISEVWLDFTPAPVVETEWTWDMRRASLPSGASVQYWWTIENKTGDKLVTPVEMVSFKDLRYSWQSLTEGQITIFWHEGGLSFANDLMAASQEAMVRLAGDTNVYLEQPVSIYIYAGSDDLRGAMVFPREWTGGVAYTEYGIIALGISPQRLDWGRDALAHELGHLVIHQITFSPYGASIPTWLDEGMAMHAEGKADAYIQSWLKRAISEQKLISVRSLSSPFSAIPEQAYISYAQSQSIVEFLIQNYGKDKILQLLSLLKEGNTCDEALLEIYGFDQDGLDSLWGEYIIEQSQSQSGFGCAPLWGMLRGGILAEGVMNRLPVWDTLAISRGLVK